MDKKIKNKILIVGGTGFIGYHLAKKTVKLGWDVTSFSINKPKNHRRIKQVKYKTGNLYRKNSLKKIDQNFDYIVNLGGYVDHVNKNKNLKSHFIGCKNLVSIFSKKKIKFFLQVGSGAEYGNTKSPHNEKTISLPKSIYGRPKFLATRFLMNEYKKYNFPCAVVRLYQVFGENQDSNRIIPFIIRSCFLNKPFPCSDGKQYRDFIDVDQVIDVFIKILKSKNTLGKIFNLGSGKIIKVKSLIKLIKFYVKKGKPKYGKIKMRKDEQIKFFPNINKLKKTINWKPKNNFKKKLLSTINFEKKLSKNFNN